jgi:hypothetical protein
MSALEGEADVNGELLQRPLLTQTGRCKPCRAGLFARGTQ